MTLTEINRYPVKSCRGEALQTASIESCGLVGDRRWMTVATPASMTTLITIHGGGPYPARLAKPAAHAWFSAVVGRPVRPAAVNPKDLRKQWRTTIVYIYTLSRSRSDDGAGGIDSAAS